MCHHVAFALLLLFCRLPTTHSSVDKRLNIVLVVAEDLGAAGIEALGASVLPHLHSLPVSFNHAYATQSNCSPARSSLLTGLYPHQNGQVGLSYRVGGALKGWGVRAPHVLLARQLQPHYTTFGSYKVHVGPDEAAHEAAFDRFVDWGAVASVNVAGLATAFDEFVAGATRPFFAMVNLFDTHRDENGVICSKWSRKRYGSPQRPYLTWANVSRPATPWLGHDFQPEGLEMDVAGYYNGIRRVDEALGRLLAVLAARRHEHDTLVLVTADHGPAFGRAKLTLYEPGIRVPLFARWPGVTPRDAPQRTRSELVSGVDLHATVLDAARLRSDDARTRGNATFVGRSLRALLAANSTQRVAHWRPFVASTFFAHEPHCCRPTYAVRDHRYKLILNLLATRRGAPPARHSACDSLLGGIDGWSALQSRQEREHPATPLPAARGAPALEQQLHSVASIGAAAARVSWADLAERLRDPPRFELYDLLADPRELVNLAQSRAHRVPLRRLKTALASFREETRDPLLHNRTRVTNALFGNYQQAKALCLQM